MLGFVPQPNLQVTVINPHLNYAMLRLLAKPIFYERVKMTRLAKERVNGRALRVAE